MKHDYVYLGSLIAAVPGNFLGFYLFGYILRKKFTCGRFIFFSQLTLTLANLVVAALYILVDKTLYMGQLSGLGRDSLALLFIGLILWWFITMLPFVLLMTPPLIRAAVASFPSVVPEDVRMHSLSRELPERGLALSMVVPGLVMVLLGAVVTCTGLGTFMTASFGQGTKTLIEEMTYISDGALTLIGSTILIKKRASASFMHFYNSLFNNSLKTEVAKKEWD